MIDPPWRIGSRLRNILPTASGRFFPTNRLWKRLDESTSMRNVMHGGIRAGLDNQEWQQQRRDAEHQEKTAHVSDRGQDRAGGQRGVNTDAFQRQRQQASQRDGPTSAIFRRRYSRR